MRKFTSLAAAAAVVITSVGFSAVPAEARSRHGGWGYRDRDNISTGDVLGGLLIIGTIAAIASAASKDKRERAPDYRYDPPYRDTRPDTNYEPPVDDRPDTDDARAYGNGDVEARAADACSWAVEAEMGDDARVDRIDGTEANNGGWYVTGTASRLGGEVRSFGCSYRNGRVVDVNFG
ncbi:hypothetical protein [Sphingopyxis sp.]|uniref:hypothetical protein n=1 Tax=Sphingopyxis sp. TaxID=1908224 RepID=UPI003D0D4B56